MDLEEAKKAVDYLITIGVNKIVLIGGEPTVYKHFIELIQYISEKNVTVSVATNGRKFKDMTFAKKVVDAGITGINISIKATSEEDYIKYTF